MSTDSLDDLQARLEACRSRDRHALHRQIQRQRRQPDAVKLAELAARVDASAASSGARAASVPALQWPALPVCDRRDELARAISDHQVVVVAGETGSGKTTQLPKICLSLGRGVRGLIGHTQPRRLAARAVASRVAEELGTQVGDKVGMQVRFADNTSEASLLKVMTDGILLAEIQRDRFLNAYDTLIIDEAQNLSAEMLEEVRLLSNLETSSSKLIQIMLVGQPELKEMLRRPDLRQLKQRIALSQHLRPFNESEMREYIENRLRKAGFTGRRIFKRDALKSIFHFSEGTPRLINSLCDGSLLLGFARQKTLVDARMVEEVASDLDIVPVSPEKVSEGSEPGAKSRSRKKGIFSLFR